MGDAFEKEKLEMMVIFEQDKKKLEKRLKKKEKEFSEALKAAIRVDIAASEAPKASEMEKFETDKLEVMQEKERIRFLATELHTAMDDLEKQKKEFETEKRNWISVISSAVDENVLNDIMKSSSPTDKTAPSIRTGLDASSLLLKKKKVG